MNKTIKNMILFLLLFHFWLLDCYSTELVRTRQLNGSDCKYILLSFEIINNDGFTFFSHNKEKIERFKQIAKETDLSTFVIKGAEDYKLFLKLQDWNNMTEEDFWEKYLDDINDYDITVSYTGKTVHVYYTPVKKNKRGGDYFFVFDIEGNLLEKKFGA